LSCSPSRGLLLALLSSCGWLEEVTDGPRSTVDSPFGPAEELSADELDALAGEGDVFEVEPRTIEEERKDRAARVAEAEALIDDFLAEHPELEGTLLQQADPNAPRVGPNLLHTLPDGREVVLQGEDWDRLVVASVIERQRDAAHQAEILLDMLPLVPPHCRELAPATNPRNLDAETLVNARAAVVRCFMDWRGLAPEPELRPFESDPQSLPDQWSTRSGACDLDADDTDGPGGGNDGYAARLPNLPSLQSWPLLEQLPAVRSQARRGTCVAFATASAIEHAFLRRSGAVVDVSEQYLYSVGKWDFEGDHYDDGLNTTKFTGRLASRGTNIAVEDGWGYNPSWCRLENDRQKRYRDSCVAYGGRACSETAHQLDVVSSGGDLALFRPTSAETVQVRVATELDLYGLYWETLGHSDLYLSAGYGVVASLRWPDNDWGIGDDGFATEGPEGDEGGHAVHLIGWQRTNDPGGGLVIFKNSWGAGWGDDGYGYLPLAYFGSALKSLVAIDVVDEANDPPEIRIPENGQDYPQGTSFTLTAAVTDEAGDDCCRITWSEGGNVIGTGPAISLTPDDLGTHRITASARDPYGAFDEYTAEIEVYDNDSPSVRIERPRVQPGQAWVTVPRNEWISFSATVTDPNQTIPCDDREWRITGQPTRTGCTLNTYLTENGVYTVTHSAEDEGGAVASDSIRLLVKDWTEFDPPYFTIREPRANDLLVYNEVAQVRFVALPSAAEGEFHWELDTVFGYATFDENRPFSFIPDDELTVPNDRTDASLRAEYTIDGVTVTDEIPLRLLGRPN